MKSLKAREDEDFNPAGQIANLLNDYTYRVYDKAAYDWRQLEAKFWQMFGSGF